MKRRTILALLAAAPFAAFTATAHAFGIRRRHRGVCDPCCADDRKRDIDPVVLKITPLGGEPGMEMYKVEISQNVKVENGGGIEEQVDSAEVKASLREVGSTSNIADLSDVMMSPPTTSPPYAGIYSYTTGAGGIMLTPGHDYEAVVVAPIKRTQTGISDPQRAA